MTQRPLEGVLVVSLEQAVAAPMASQRLAEAGARVIKVERPEGDFARGYDRAAGGISSYFAWLNRGKESVALDLKNPADMAVMRAMLARADVFIQNLAHGATGRMGLDAATLRAARPEMVVCDMSGYGPDGPYATAKAYDLLIQAESGIIAVSGAPGAYGRIGVSLADIGTGINAAGAIATALVRRFRTGEGASLEVSLFDSMAEWMTVPLLHHDYLGRAPGQAGLAHPSIAPYGAFATKDGGTILISIQSDREWRVLAGEVMGNAALAADPALATNNQRVAERARTDGEVAAWFVTVTRAEAEARLSAARVAFGALNDVPGLSQHAQLDRWTATHEAGTVSLPMPAARADWIAEASVPALDQHGAAIRAEFAGD
ncbi:CoA transferase [Limibaculum sp. M0105]|uniref:CoA transferase n=1 Tax=Thermohalobaculum xanthum TaxID=2753746 RepID=A0A8J7M3P2_9RHOB|nr:CaiB/BaiF CoA-transferase family protein [Thermohalobaculum xanthum]MBK0397613.1 CoA transferase [Thermohalobaculum xanthum]